MLLKFYINNVYFFFRWPALIPTIIAHIQSHDVLKMYNSLLALRKVAKRYEYKSKGDRKPLNDIVEVSFPHLQTLMTQVFQYNSIEAAQVMKMCLKIFWSATMYELPQVAGVDVNFWFGMIAQILDKPLPEASEGLEPAGQPTDPEDRAAWPWWKVRSYTAQVLSIPLISAYNAYLPPLPLSTVEEVGSPHRESVHPALRQPPLRRPGQPAVRTVFPVTHRRTAASAGDEHPGL